jgi:hypothetical protein
MPQIYSYNIDKKRKNQFDLEASMGYKINKVNFMYNLSLSNFRIKEIILNGYATACLFG